MNRRPSDQTAHKMRRALLGTLLLVAAATASRRHESLTQPMVSCPPRDFTNALRRLATHLRPGTMARAGGVATLVTHYRTHYGGVCLPYNVPGGPHHNHSWPRSALKTGKKKLILDLSEGTTGTRFLHCVASTGLGLDARHGVGKARKFTTRDFDSWAMVMDSPVPYLVRQLVEAHSSTQLGTFLTVRDPWDWHVKRFKHRGAHGKANWTAAGACSGRPTPLGAPDASAMVPRDLLVFFAWTLCLTRARGFPCPVINLFDDHSPGQLTTK